MEINLHVRSRSNFINFFGTFSILSAILLICLWQSSLYAQDWKEEFDEICSKVNIAHTLKVEQLQELIHRADLLIRKLQSMDIKSKRLYIFRLKKCKKFFQYNVEIKNKPN